MHSHVDIQIDKKSLSLPDDFSISITDQNPLFNDNEMYSFPVAIPLNGNRHILKNIDDKDSGLRPIGFEHQQARISVDGMPFRSGQMQIQEDEELEDNISMNVTASDKSLETLIGDLSCRDIPVKDKIMIGEKIGNIGVSVQYLYSIHVNYKNSRKKDFDYKSVETVHGSLDPQALGFSYPGICETTTDGKETAIFSSLNQYPNGNRVINPKVVTSFINTNAAYGENFNDGTAKYCNARVCYKHYALGDNNRTDTSNTVKLKDSKFQLNDIYPYWVLEADRPQSGVCFYVLYFLDCLFTYLGMSFDNSALTEIGDFDRLCFFTTHCKYTVENKKDSAGNDLTLSSFNDINNWLASRGCGGQIKIEDPETKVMDTVTFKNHDGQTNTYTVGENGVKSMKIWAEIQQTTVSSNIQNMYASSDNFPDKSVKTILDSLKNAFGICFDYDYDRKQVKAYLLRDVFRKKDKAIPLMGQITSINKMSEKITGFRMKYSAESDSAKQNKNITEKTKDYDTSYDYIDYPGPNLDNGYQTVIDQTYQSISINAGLRNGDCKTYVDQNTGNAYRLKVDKNANTTDKLHPVLFEVGQFKGVEVGDCSTSNKDFITEMVNDFQPIDFNDINYIREAQKASGSDVPVSDPNNPTIVSASANSGETEPILAAFVDKDMEHEFVEQKIRNTISDTWVDIYLTEELYLVESYDPSKTDDGNSPLQTYDWGLAIAVMRGSGSMGGMELYGYDYDMFGNSKWRVTANKYFISSDTMDAYGNEFDYNGSSPDVGLNERFSLKIRAYKQPSWANGPLCATDEYDANGNIVTRIRSRGLYDVFMAEYAYFILNRRKFKIKGSFSAMQLIDIKNHWMDLWTVDGLKFWIDTVKYDLSKAKGIDNAELEVYAI